MAKTIQGNLDARQGKAVSRQGDAPVWQMYGGVLDAAISGNIAIYDDAGNVIDSGVSLAAVLAGIGNLPALSSHWAIDIQPGYALVW